MVPKRRRAVAIDLDETLLDSSRSIGPLSLEMITAFGDDSNDIPLVVGAGCGVAMGNAIEALKMVADCLTATHDEDGVGQFLKGLLNEQKDNPTHYL